MATYYVSKSGNNAWTGTAPSQVGTSTTGPKLTIAAGVALPGPGDTLYIRAGTYLEPIHLTTLGNPNGWITVSGYQNEIVIIRIQNTQSFPIGATLKQYHIYQKLVIDGTDHTLKNDQGYVSLGVNSATPDATHDVIFQNNEIRFLDATGIFSSCQGTITIRDNVIHDLVADDTVGNRFYGMYIAHGNGFVIEGNHVYNCPGGGLQIYPEPRNVIVRRNRIHHCNSLSQSHVGGIVVDFGTGTPITGVQIYNNLVYQNGTPTSGNAYGIHINDASGTKVWNNTVYGNKHTVNTGDAGQPSSNTEIRNNIIYLNTFGAAIVGSGTGTVQSNNLSTNPNFVNAAAGDFHLQASSTAAINQGVTVAVPNDFELVPRPQGPAYDIGAYEYASVDTTAPAAPTGLTLSA